MMSVTVALGPPLNENGPKSFRVELHEGSSIRGLLDALGMASSENLLIVRNGRVVDANHRLQEGDQIVLLYPLSGG